MISHKIAFSRTVQLIKKYIAHERKLISRVFAIVLIKNLVILPVPFLIQMLVNDYLSLNVDGPLIAISILIFLLLLLSYSLDNCSVYLAELLKRDLFVRNFFKIFRVLGAQGGRVVNTDQVPRFLEVSGAKNDLSSVLKYVSHACIVVIFGTVIISSYHPFFLIYSILLILSVGLILSFLYPKALLFKSIVSDSKYKANERLMQCSRMDTQIDIEPSFNSISLRYVKFRSKFFAIIIKKKFYIAALVAFAQGLFIFLSGKLIFSEVLSIGQFVAAEIVLTYILASIVGITASLEEWINVIVSLDKLDSVIMKKV